MPKIRLPDGNILNVPDDVNPEQVKRTLIQKHPEWFPDQSLGSQAVDTLQMLARSPLDMAANVVSGAGAFGEALLSRGIDPLPSLVDQEPGNPLTEAGEGIKQFGENVAPTDPRYEQSFPGQVTTGLGQVGNFIAQGMINPALPFFSGAMLTADEASKDAIAHNATGEEAHNAALWGALLGTTEALPIAHLLGRLPRAARSRSLKALREGGIQAFEEAIQETGQQGGLNWYAQMSHDEQRELTESLGESAAVGGTVGAITGALMGALIPGKTGISVKDTTDPNAPATGEGVDGETTTTVGEAETKVRPEEVVTTEKFRQYLKDSGLSEEQTDAAVKIWGGFAATRGKDLDDFIAESVAGVQNTPAEGPETFHSFVGTRGINYDALGDGEVGTGAIAQFLHAEKLQKEGKNAEEIFANTGWVYGPEGAWRFEVSDHDAQVNKAHAMELYNRQLLREKTTTIRLKDLLDHQDIYDLYPQISRKTTFTVDPDMQMDNASYNRQTHEIRVSPDLLWNMIQEGNQGIGFATLMHELQHNIQNLEDFATGGGTDMFQPGTLMAIKRYLGGALTDEQSNITPDEAIKAIKEVDAIFNFITDNGRIWPDENGHIPRGLDKEAHARAYLLYRRLHGEQEADEVKLRAKLTPEERRKTPLRFVDALVLDGKKTIFSNAVAAIREAEKSGGLDKAVQKILAGEDVEFDLPSRSYYQEEGKAKGAVTFLEDTKAIFQLFDGADISTVMHESAHIFRRWLSPEELAVANTFVEAKDGKSWTREQEEKWARGFERYLRRNRKSKVPGLDEIFEKMRTWLRRIYKTVKGSPIDVELTPEIISLFDKILVPIEMPTRTPQHAMTFEQWVKVVGDDLAAMEGVPDKLAVPRPKRPSSYTLKLQHIMTSTRWTPVVEQNKKGEVRPLDAAVAEVTDPNYNRQDNPNVEALRNNRKAYVLAQKAFLDGTDLTPFVQIMSTLREQAGRTLDSAVVREVELSTNFIKQLKSLQDIQKDWMVPARQKLLELGEKYGQEFVMERDTGTVFAVERKGTYDYALAEFEGNEVRRVAKEGFYSQYLHPNIIDPLQDWTVTKGEWLLEKHYEMVLQAIEDGQNVPSVALEPHINRDPSLLQLYKREKAIEEQDETQAQEQKAKVDTFHQEVHDTPTPENKPIKDTFDQSKVEQQSVGKDIKSEAIQVGRLLDMAKGNIERLTNALRHETQVELKYILDKGMVQRLTSMRGPVADHTFAEYFADLLNSIDDMRALLETDLKTIITNKDFAKIADRATELATETTEWITEVQNARPGLLDDEPSISWANRIWEFANRMIGKTPGPESSLAWSIRKGTMTMQWMAKRFPIVRPLFEAGAIDRLNNANMQSSILMHGSETEETVLGFGPNHTIVEKKIKAPGVNSVNSFPKSGAMYVALQRLVLASDETSKVLHSIEDLVVLLQELTDENGMMTINDRTYDMNFDADQIRTIFKSYQEIQGTFSYIYDKLVNKLIDQFGAERAKKMAKNLFPNGKQPGYFPHMRIGDFRVVVKKGDKVVKSIAYNNPWDQTKAIKQLKQEYGEGHWVGIPPTDEKRLDSVGPEDVLSAIREVVATADLEMDVDQRRKVEEAMDNAAMQIFKHHGLYTSLQERENTPGFDERIFKVLYTRIEDFSAGIAKVEFAQKGLEGLSAIRHHGTLYNYAHEWYSQMLTAADKQDRFIGKVRALIFFRYLGFNLKTGFVVFADKITNAPAQLGIHTKHADRKIMKALGETVTFRTWLNNVEKMMKKEGIRRSEAIEKIGLPNFIKESNWSDAEKKQAMNAMLWAWDVGATRAKFTAEILEREETTWEKGTDVSSQTQMGQYLPMANAAFSKAFDYSAMFVRHAEELNRMSTFLAAYKVFAKEKGYDFDRASRQAQMVTNDAHFLYGKVNVPLLFNRKGGKYFKMAYIFRAFEHNYVQMLQSLMFSHGNKGKVMALKSLLYLSSLGGMASVPFFQAMAKAAGIFFDGDDPEEMIKRSLNDVDSTETLATLFSDGVPGLANISIRSSLQVGAYDTWNEILFGVAGSAARDAVDITKFARAGDWEQFARKALPTAMANPWKAIEGREHGVISRHGTPLREMLIGRQLKYTPYETAAKLVGFQPIREARAYRLKRAVTEEARYWSDRRSDIYSRISRAVRTDSQGQLAQALQDIVEYEKDRRANKAIDIPSITRQSLRQSLSEAQLRKREVLRVLRMTGRLPLQ